MNVKKVFKLYLIVLHYFKLKHTRTHKQIVIFYCIFDQIMLNQIIFFYQMFFDQMIVS